MSEPATQHEPHEEEVLGKAYDSRLMRRLLSYIRPYGGTTAVSLVLILLSSLLQLVGPLVTAVAVDLFIRPSGGAPRFADVDTWWGPIESIQWPPSPSSSHPRSSPPCASLPEEFAREMRVAAAVEWYAEDIVSQGEAAGIAGVAAPNSWTS